MHLCCVAHDDDVLRLDVVHVTVLGERFAEGLQHGEALGHIRLLRALVLALLDEVRLDDGLVDALRTQVAQLVGARVHLVLQRLRIDHPQHAVALFDDHIAQRLRCDFQRFAPGHVVEAHGDRAFHFLAHHDVGVGGFGDDIDHSTNVFVVADEADLVRTGHRQDTASAFFYDAADLLRDQLERIAPTDVGQLDGQSDSSKRLAALRVQNDDVGAGAITQKGHHVLDCAICDAQIDPRIQAWSLGGGDCGEERQRERWCCEQFHVLHS